MVLNVAEGVDVRKVDLSIELQILAFHAQRRSVERNGHASEGELRNVTGEAELHTVSGGAARLSQAAVTSAAEA
jgi:redox-sensing transcriptional repressor